MVGFASCDVGSSNPIATSGDRACVGARVVIVPVAVIADFEAWVPFIHIEPHDAITACGRPAGVCAGIGGQFVAVIAGFVAAVVNGLVGADNAIATTRLLASGGAGIGVFGVAVIAGF